MKNQQNKRSNNEPIADQATKQLFDKNNSDPEHKRTRKPGSQSNSSKQGNNGRGGGK